MYLQKYKFINIGKIRTFNMRQGSFSYSLLRATKISTGPDCLVCESFVEMMILFCTLQAHSAYRGIGIVKLMGRSSGFIAMQASLASGQIDICLIPEVLLLSTLLKNINLW